MWSGRLPQVHWTLIAGRGASSVTFRMQRARPPEVAEPALPRIDFVRLDRREDDSCRKNQKLFSKTSAQTVGH